MGLCGAVLATGCGREEGPQLREWRLPATDSYPVVGQVTAIASGRGVLRAAARLARRDAAGFRRSAVRTRTPQTA